MRVLAIFPKSDALSNFSSPYNGLIEAFEALGISLYVLAGFDFIGGNLTQLRSAETEDLITKLVLDINPDIVISINNHGMTKCVRAAMTVPVVKWLFDDVEHYFVHESFSSWPDSFDSGDIVVCYSSELRDRVQLRCPFLLSRPLFLPHATSTDLFRNNPMAPSHNVSFIGSYLDVGPALHFLQHFGYGNQQVPFAIEDIIKGIRRAPQAAIDAEISSHGLAERISSFNMRPSDFKRILSDVITTRDRLAAVTSLRELGIAVFGKNDWVLPLIFFEGSERIFQYNARLDTQADLVRAYQSSLITIDVPNIQNRTAVGGRVIEAMASGSLLITRSQEGSDLYKIFGSDCPVPTYRDLPHLFSLCSYYLMNPEETEEIVAQCNRLVSKGFDYTDRVLFILELASLQAPAERRRVSATFIRDLGEPEVVQERH